MSYAEQVQELNQFRLQIGEMRNKLREMQAQIEPEPVNDYQFADSGGPVKLSELFGEHDTLFVIHNMGKACMYCTLWADGLNGVIDHIQSRAAFALSSPDDPETQAAFAKERGWRFHMVSHAGTSFAEDMGYTSEHGFEPGVSVFRRTEDAIVRVSDTSFGPGDDFCIVWPLFDLMPEGPDGWAPRYRYG